MSQTFFDILQQVGCVLYARMCMYVCWRMCVYVCVCMHVYIRVKMWGVIPLFRTTSRDGFHHLSGQNSGIPLQSLLKICTSTPNTSKHKMRKCLKDEQFSVFTSATSSEMDTLASFLAQTGINPSSCAKSDLDRLPVLKQFLNHCCQTRHYSFCILKCGSSDCQICKPPCLPKEVFETLHYISNPICVQALLWCLWHNHYSERLALSQLVCWKTWPWNTIQPFWPVWARSGWYYVYMWHGLPGLYSCWSVWQNMCCTT